MIAVVLGPDAATARAEVAGLIQRHDPDGSNTSYIDGRTATVAQILASVASVGFFSTGRLVVVHDFLARATKPGKQTATDSSETDTPAIDVKPLFAGVPTENTLILVDTSLTSVPAAVKRALPKDARIIAGDPPRGNQLLDWLMRVAKEEGSSLDQQTARILAASIYPQTWATKPSNPRFDRPPDLDLLRNEVAKLATAAYPDPITRQHVKTLVASGDDDRIFRFIEAAASGNLASSLPELDRLLQAGEEPFKINAQLHQQIELAAVIATATRTDSATVGKALGLPNPNRMIGVSKGSRGASPAALTGAVIDATKIDRQVKRGELRDPTDATYHLITAIAGTRKSGT